MTKTVPITKPSWFSRPSPAPAQQGQASTGLAELQTLASEVLGRLPGNWRQVARSWPEPWLTRWADLAEAGEAEGLSSREAGALAFDVFVHQVPAEQLDRPPMQDFDFAGWSPTTHPIDPAMCAGGKARRVAKPRSKA